MSYDNFMNIAVQNGMWHVFKALLAVFKVIHVCVRMIHHSGELTSDLSHVVYIHKVRLTS